MWNSFASNDWAYGNVQQWLEILASKKTKAWPSTKTKIKVKQTKMFTPSYIWIGDKSF